MSSLTDLARIHTELDTGEIGYLQRLVAGWNLLADLSFADLILFAPVGDPASETKVGNRVSRFVALAQIRPSTVQTIYDSDWVGTLVEADDRPVVTRSFTQGQIVEGEIDHDVIGERLQVMSVPIRCGTKVIGVLSRESVPSARRSTGALERSYAEIFNRLARMISAGRFPFPGADRGGDDVPRVGDGSVLLDREGRVVFCSPNASSALHRMGAQTITEDTRVTVGGLFETVIRPAFSTRLPVTEEIDVRHDAVVLAHCVPLLEPDGTVANGLLLLRDISELKRLDRLLMSKDATIREIHHRVKNNLQTISSLLRLQARRTSSAEAKAAIEESVRRIGAIALVHETLSREAGDEMPFLDIIKPLVRMVEESMLLPDAPVRFRVTGDSITLSSAIATPLSVVLTELMQNAVDHAFVDDRSTRPPEVSIDVRLLEDELRMDVRDNGDGPPDDLTIGQGTGLGLSIVQTLVHSELGGTLTIARDPSGIGTVVETRVPLTEELIINRVATDRRTATDPAPRTRGHR